MTKEYKEDNYLLCQNMTFHGLVNKESYIVEAKEGFYIPVKKGSEDEEEEEKVADDKAEAGSQIFEDESEESMTEAENDFHPKNRVAVHEIIIDKEKEQLRDFNDLDNPDGIGIYLNKKLKFV